LIDPSRLSFVVFVLDSGSLGEPVDSFVNANRSTQLDDVKANVGQLSPFPQLPKKAFPNLANPKKLPS
jgi:hypothetical protein